MSDIDTTRHTRYTLQQLIDNAAAYMSRREQRMNPPVTPIPFAPSPPPPRFTYAEAREAFWTAYTMQLRCYAPFVHTDNAPIVQQLVRYHTSCPDCALAPHKGLYLYGAYGSGKSALIKSLIAFSATYPHHLMRRPVWIHYKKFKKTGTSVDEVLSEWSGYEIVIDDLGYEEDSRTSTTNSYGTITNIVQEVVRYRYEIYQSRGIVTHFTTNKSPEEIRDLYGEGTSTRLKEMCTPLLWRGGSLRK